MRNILLTLLLIFAIIFNNKEVTATHAAGGELTYTHMSGNTYQFTFKFFRDCTGIGAPTTVPLCIYNACSNTSYATINLPRIVGNIPGTSSANGSPTSPGCPGFQTSCQNPSSSVQGYSEWWYRGTFTLPNPGVTCDQWRFNTYIGARNPSTNITGGTFYVEAFLNRRPVPSQAAINNNSPYFTNSPIPYFCSNQPNTFNNGTAETDGDSITFTSIAPYNQTGCTHFTANTSTYTNASYNPTTNPFNTSNTFNVNPANGNISFTPNGVQTPTISIKVNEYRNGVLIGYVMRDIQMVILNCTTPNPIFSIDTNTLSGGVQNSNGIDLCHGQNFSVCFDVSSSSSTALINMSDNSQAIVPTSTLTYTGIGTDSVTGCFNWTPTLADTGLHIITITATDSSCAPPGILISQTFTMALNVHQSFPMTVTSTNPACGNNNGSITANSPGATTYLLMPNNITNGTGMFTGLGSGVYTISVPNGGVCALPQTLSLQPPTNMTWSNVTQVNPPCSPPAGGSISAQVTGGSAPITYGITPAVAPNNATGMFSSLAPGTYTISATDALNCTINTQVTLSVPLPLALSNPILTHASCPILANGIISTAALNSNNPPVTYTINPGTASNTTGTFTGLIAGTYIITATDASGCTGTISATINNPLLPTFTNVATVQPSCTQPLGSIIVSAFSIFFGPLTYNLQPNNITNTNGSFFLLPGNTYIISVTDGTGCSATTTVALNLGGGVNVSAIPTNGNCSSLGSIQSTASGGAPAYSYNLMPGNITNGTGTFNNLAAGSYTITVTDATNCTGSSVVTIVNPQLPTWTSVNSGNPLCNTSTGWINATATSLNTPMSYTLMPINITNSTGSFTNLPPGNYTLTATDNSNCDTSVSFVITAPPIIVWGTLITTMVSCNGGTDGSLSISASGGTPALSYNLMPGNVTNGTGAFTALTQGSYTVTVTDGNNCTLSTTITITEPPVLIITNIATATPSCMPGNDGSITVTATGGATAYQYNIGGANQSGNVFNNLGSGVYTVTVTDANNCTVTTNVNITAPNAPTITNTTTTNVSCNNGANGTIILTATGGTAPLSYNLMPGNITNGSGIFMNLIAGIYAVVVSDALGCSVSTSITIAEPTAVVWDSVNQVNVSCNGGTDGSIQASVSGGTGLISYVLNPGNIANTTGSYPALSAGTYTVTASDANSCTIIVTITIIQPPVLSITNIATTTPSCVPGNDGSITVTATGGTTTYQYNIGGANQASNLFTNVGSGVYTVTVTDANNCTTTTSVNITAPNAPNITNAASTNVSCNGGTDGTITLTTTGGTNPLSYTLLPGNVTNGTGVYTNLSANSYIVTVTDAIGCSASTTISITEPSQVVWDSVNQQNVSCNGGSDGSLQVSASGGTGTMTYVLNPGAVSNTTGTYPNLLATTYTITATDANSCSISTTITITEPPVLQWGTPSTTMVSCNGGSDGSLSISASGGTPALSYNLLPGNVTNGTGAFTSLTQGSYTVTVTDANSCTLSTTIPITEPPILSITNIATTTPSCVPGNDGSITVTATGGTTTYQYNIGGANQASNLFTNVGSGVYTVTVTDANNCTTTTSVNITAPNAPNITNAASTNVSCNGGTDGTITLTTTGGTNPLSYTLLPGNVTNGTGVYTNLSANSYIVTVTDAIGCSASTTISITEPSQVVWDSVNQQNVSCNGGSDGSLQVSASGGTGTMTYVLNPGAVSNTTGTYPNLLATTYTITATDANSCSISTTITITEPPVLQWGTPSTTMVSCNGGSDGSLSISASGGTPALSYNLLPGNVTNGTGAFTSLTQGSYTVTVTDANSCTLSTTIPITEPPILSITNIATTTPSCVPGNDGSITVTATGGTTTYQYNIGGANQASNLFTNVGSGVYTVTVTDANNCTTTTSVNITAPNAPNITNAASTNVSCNGGTDGTITLTTTGGTNPLSYTLLPGNVTNGTGVYTNLSANSYIVTVTDAIGCSASTTISITEPSQVVWDSVSQQNVSCNGGSDGSLQVSASGGTGTMTYVLNPGAVSNTTGTYPNLLATTYTITATDANSCSISTTITITEPPVLQWGTPSTTMVSCNGGSDGSLSISASGGTPALSYNLLPGNVTNGTGAFTSLTQGSYTVTVTDANSCTLSTTIPITEPPILSITNIATTTPSCVPGNDGSITVTATGGTTTYQYNIGGANQASNLFNNVGSGVYTVTVTDANNCTTTTSVNITAPNAPNITNAASTNVSCNGGTDGTITLTTTGGTNPLSYTLLPGNVTNGTGVYTNLSANSYIVTVTDAIGCSASTTISITEPSQVVWDSVNQQNVSCNGGSDGSLQVSASGGTGTMTYVLNPGAVSNTTGTYPNLLATTYTITATDANSCSISTTITITEPPVLQWGTPSTTMVSCNGGSDGSLSISASGGTPALSYNLLPGNVTNGTGAFTSLTQGSYTVTVTDANSCTLSTTIPITEPPILSITNIATTTPSCVPGNDGSITVTATGGTTTYQYNIGGANQASNLFNNVGSGVYTVTVTDANNCTTTTSVNITAPNAPNITNAASTNVSCNGGTDGTITLTTTGGTNPLSYTLLPGNVTNGTGVYTNLSANSYIVTVTDAIGCSASTTISITEPSQVVWDSVSQQNVSCNGGSDGSLQVSASGGTGTMTYVLNPGAVSNTTGTYPNLLATTYTITATDANSCSISTTITITEPPVLQWGTPSTTMVSCNGGSDGSLSISASGGTPALSYNLLPGNVTNGTGAFTSLTQGSYTVTVTDANSCTLSTTIPITEPPILSITNIATTTPSCVPGNDGSITVTATGGTTTYQYNIGGANQASNFFNNVGSGVYTVTVTDANNCTVTSAVNIMAPNTPSITNVLTTAASCVPGNDGSITVTASNGLAPYQFNIGGANQANNIFTGVGIGTYIITVTDANGCTGISTTIISNQPSPTITATATTAASCIPGCDGIVVITATGGTNPVYTYSINGINFQSSNTFNSLCANSYIASVQDGNGCMDTMSFVISTANGPIIASVIIDSVDCSGGNDGSIVLQATGGANPLNYNLMPGNINNANGIFSTLITGSYLISVTDANGCSINTTVVVSEPLPVQYDSVAGSGSSCSGSGNGTIYVSNIGGTGAFMYTINPTAIFTPPGTFSNLQGNSTYVVTAVDANGCSITTSIYISSPAAMSITNATTTPVICNGDSDGTAQIAASGGTLPYNYNMQPNNVTNATGNFMGLSGATYLVTVTDANNCSVTTNITVNEPAAIQVNNVTIQDVTCFGDADGSIQINATGGIPTLTYNLQPTNQTNSTGSFANLSGPIYTITITDANNCTLTTMAIVNEPNALIIDSLNPAHVSCSGADDGQITVHASGGNGGNIYYLQPLNINNTTGVFSNLPAQQYYVTVVDTNNCITYDSILITEPNLLTASHSRTNVNCFGGNDGTITALASGGTPGFTYTLSPGNTVNTTGAYTGLIAGVYNITVVDANGCSTVIIGIQVNQPPALQMTSLSIEDVICYGDNTGRISAAAIGGTAPLQYSITPTGGTQVTPGSFVNLYAGSYIVTVTDANNCTLTSLAIVNQNPELLFDTVIVTEPLCYGDDNGTIEFIASGGIGPILYSMNNGPATTINRYTNLFAGYYLVTAIDSLGCRRDSGITLNQPEPVAVSTIDLTHLSCANAKDGIAIVQSTGGVGYHTYYVRPGIQWNRTGAFSNLGLGYYTVKVVDTNQCETDSFFTITNNPNQMVTDIVKKDLPCRGIGLEGEAEVIVTGGEQPLSYIWNTNPAQFTQKITGLRFGWYFVLVLDAKGCEIRDSIHINPGDCCTELFLPNAFSPNKDGKNDEFRVISTAGIELKQFEIFNRWGQKIWSTNTYYDGWDGYFAGKKAAVGTYYYVYRYRCLTDGKEYIKKGDLTLIR